MAENYIRSHWRVIYPKRPLQPQPEASPKPAKKPPKNWRPIALGIVIIGLLLAVLRPIPSPQPVSTFRFSSTKTNVQLPFPAYGQSAIGAEGYGLLASHGPKTPVPMASIAKVVTALAILKQKPLAATQQGPKITITQQDIDYYNDYYNQGGSIVTVSLGEQISEYQALQALLIPSANNFADTLARWAFGSPQKYVDYANNFVKTLGMGSTTLADASGLAPGSTSTAEDLVVLGQAALAQPVVAEIIKQDKASLPVTGEVEATNGLLGVDSITGIKTGNTDEAGGCFLFAATRQVDGQPITVVGVILGAPSLGMALNDSRPLLRAVDGGFKNVSIVSPGQKIGRYDLPWGGSVPVVAQKKLSMLEWQAASVQSSVGLKRISASADRGQQVGTLTIINEDKTEKVPLVLGKDLPGASLSWRLFR